LRIIARQTYLRNRRIQVGSGVEEEEEEKKIEDPECSAVQQD
jgi:hypothetical protein